MSVRWSSIECFVEGCILMTKAQSKKARNERHLSPYLGVRVDLRAAEGDDLKMEMHGEEPWSEKRLVQASVRPVPCPCIIWTGLDAPAHSTARRPSRRRSCF